MIKYLIKMKIIIITLTIDKINNIYSETDKILYNISNGNYVIFYSGQNLGIYDKKLIDAVHNKYIFRVYYRLKINSPFIFLGFTDISEIYKIRSIDTNINSLPNQRLQIKLVIESKNVSNQLIHSNNNFIGSGKYKKDILIHSNFNTNFNINLGFFC